MRSVHRRWCACDLAVALGATAFGCDDDPSDVPEAGEPTGANEPTGATEAPVATEPTKPTKPTEAPADFTHISTEPCPDSRFECITLEVPRDHVAADGPRWEVTFGIQRAPGEAQGTFVTATGGPGTSGLAVADSYTDLMAPGITDNYDIVFFDQRGIGASQPLRCDQAATAYYLMPTDVSDGSQRDQVATDAQTFVDDCLAEADVAEDDLPYFAAAQAVEDLEALRQHLDATSCTCTARATAPSTSRPTPPPIRSTWQR